MSNFAEAQAAVTAWAENVAMIREDGMQVAYSMRSIPEVHRLHDEMLRALLAWHRFPFERCDGCSEPNRCGSLCPDVTASSPEATT